MGKREAKNTSVVLPRVKDRGFMVAVIGVIPTTGWPVSQISATLQPRPFYFQPLSATIHADRDRPRSSFQRNFEDEITPIINEYPTFETFFFLPRK